MKTVFAIISILLLVILIVGSLVVFGPFKYLLPQKTQQVIESSIPDYFYGSRGVVQNQDTVLPTPQSGQGTSTVESTWSLPAQSGKVIEVSAFTEVSTSTVKVPGKQPPTTNIDMTSLSSSTPFIITYVAYDKSFNIGLFKEPLGDVRKQAEETFLKILGISQGEACYLHYVVLVPSSVNSFYSGKNLGFSFCPGATKL